MSFGFGVGDFIAVGNLCWKVYTRIKDSPGDYAQLASEVSSLYAVIKETGDLLSQQHIDRDQRAKLAPCQEGCKEVLKDLDRLLSKYESLGTKSQRTFDRMGFGLQDVNAVRLRLISNVTMLDAFNHGSSNARLERKMDRLFTEVRAGKREQSVVSVETFSTKIDEDQEAWAALRRELEDVGVSSEVIIERRPFIIKWFQAALAAEHYEEDALDNLVAESVDPIPQHKRKGKQGGKEKLQAKGDFQPHSPHPMNHELLGAVMQSNTAKSKKYLKKRGAHDLGYDDEGLTALHIAVIRGDVHGVEMLLDYGADVDAETVDGKANALSFALYSYEIWLLKVLLRYGANTNAEYDEMGTPLMRAAKFHGTAEIRLLLDYGAQIDKKDNNGFTALIHAVRLSRTEVAVYLVEMGADLESRQNDGCTALIHAARSGHADIVEVLLKKGANIESKDTSGNTALHGAAMFGYVDIVKILLRMGAKTQTVNDCGISALDHARACKTGGSHEEVIRLLEAATLRGSKR